MVVVVVGVAMVLQWWWQWQRQRHPQQQQQQQLVMYVGYLNNTNNTIYITNTIYNSGRLINRVKEVNFIKFHRFNVSITFHNITSHSVRMHDVQRFQYALQGRILRWKGTVTVQKWLAFPTERSLSCTAFSSPNNFHTDLQIISSYKQSSLLLLCCNIICSRPNSCVDPVYILNKRISISRHFIVFP